MKTYALYDNFIQKRRLVASCLIRCVFALISCLLAQSAASAADLIGTVRQKGNPVAGAIVTLVPDHPSAASPAKSATDSNGNYVITDIVPGKYKLSCNGGEAEPVNIDYAINRRDCDL